ncbi:glycosyltransferase family 2 protein [Rheinheimera sp.]|uniref:glycosyltransferase family 2 protein n=1 Tax=Rheinheimera sp. TaxID=1869214 RepID=UPI00307D9087
MQRPVISVCTPTYNRAHTIARVFKSLESQSYRNFEWIIVDDGSTDNTRNVVESFCQTADFPIIYHYQANAHKKTAVNKAVSLSSGEFVLIADSDDEFPEDSIESMVICWNSIPEDSRQIFAGVSGLCEDQNGIIVGDLYPSDDGYLDSDTIALRLIHTVSGEKWGMVKRELMLKYAFPESVPGHIPENYMWSQISDGYKTRFFNKVVRIYYQDSGNQLSNINDFRPNSLGALVSKKVSLSIEIKYFRAKPTYFFMEGCRWWRFLMHSRHMAHITEYLPQSKVGLSVVALTMLPGLCWFLFDTLKFWAERR